MLVLESLEKAEAGVAEGLLGELRSALGAPRCRPPRPAPGGCEETPAAGRLLWAGLGAAWALGGPAHTPPPS